MPLQSTVNFKWITSTIKGKHHSYFQKLLNKIINILLTDPATAQMPIQSDLSLKPPEPYIHGFAMKWDEYASRFYNRTLNEAPHVLFNYLLSKQIMPTLMLLPLHPTSSLQVTATYYLNSSLLVIIFPHFCPQ
jgi:hypothetical protein